jgi:hypothetical protein
MLSKDILWLCYIHHIKFIMHVYIRHGAQYTPINGD